MPTIDEIVADPAHHRGVIKENEHPVIGPYLEIMPPARFSSSPGELRSSAPLLGQDTVSVLREIGIADDDIAHLVEIGAAIEGPAIMTTTADGPVHVDLRGAEPQAVRDAVHTWLRANWDPTMSLAAWRGRLVDAGWAVPSWPTRWHGRGLPTWADTIVAEELEASGAVGIPPGAGVRLASATILAHGPDSLRQRFLRPILTGEEIWCQLFSEPGAGSDLAGVTARAERTESGWIVNGQKLWNTSAHRAHFGLLLARTNWDAPKHRGHHLLRVADATTWRRRAPTASDERVLVVQRGVPVGRQRPAGPRDRRRGRRLARGPDHTGSRAPIRPQRPR